MKFHNEDKLLGAVDALLNRYLLAGADGEPRPMRYNPLDYQTLKFIENNPKTRATDICGALFLPPTTMQSALDRLVRMGLVQKTDHPDDGRAKVYELTQEGQKMRERILAQDRINMTEVLSPLNGNEQKTLLNLLDRIEKQLRGQ